MNKELLKRIYQALALVVVILLLTTLYSFATKSTIEVVVEGNIDPTKLTVSIDNKPLTLTDSQNSTYRTKVGRGKHTVSVSASDYTTFNSEFSTLFKSTKKFDVTLNRATANEIANDIYETAEGLQITNPRLFGNNDWLVFTLNQQDGNGGVAVARLDASNGKWVIITEGTDIDPATPGLEGAPEDLLSHLRTGL